MGSAVSSSSKTVSLQRQVVLPAAQTFSSPQIVCGNDERVQVDPMTSPPYKWICYLTTHFPQASYGASGFKIHLPDVGRTAIVTAGRVMYKANNGGFPSSITVVFPGQNSINATDQNDMYAAPEYKNS